MMAQTLTVEMYAILKEHVEAHDRIAYYEQLKAWGYAYAGLALGVVRGDTVAGRAANAFFLDQASDEGVTISPEELAQISLELMQADFDARSVGSNELSVDTIQRYHETVFDVHGVSSNAWTPDFALRSLDSLAERQGLWNALLDQGGFWDNVGDYFTLIDATEGDSSLEAVAWRLEL